MKRCFSCFKEYEHAYSICPHCGQIEITKPKEPIHLAPGTVLAGRYVLGEAVGSGGFGIVYKAWDSKLETVVAVKEFFVSRLVTRAEGLKDLIVTKKSQEEFAYRKRRFLAEARTMAKFGSHRSIPNVFEFFEDNNTAYIVMELLHGMALNDYLHQCEGKIDVDFAVMIANEVANALKSMHEQGIIHRDVAPDNIFICSGKDLRIKLMDLGAAKLADCSDEAIDIILKPGYSPTEQYENSKNIGPWTDIYALGATLYAMLTGVKPDESTNRKICDEVVPPHQLNPQIPENLSNTIMKAMALEKHMRFKSIPDFLKALNGEKKVTSLSKERKRRSLRRLGGIAAACLVVAGVTGVVLQINASKRAAQQLKDANISVWISVADGSSEETAMQLILDDFTDAFPNATVELRAFPESEYEAQIVRAAETGDLPDLFESTGLSEEILSQAQDIDRVLSSDQADECLFLDQYDAHYTDRKQIPLAIDIPVAYVITNGAAYVEYSSDYFTALSDFGTEVTISGDTRCSDLISWNFPGQSFAGRETFLNNSANTSAVLLSSTMALNEVRETLTNYEKAYVYYNSSEIYCDYTYEWSIGSGSKEQTAATERLLSWMLGSVYQNTLMISECSDGQIPINKTCFETKLQNKALQPILEIYTNFEFETKGDDYE